MLSFITMHNGILGAVTGGLVAAVVARMSIGRRGDDLQRTLRFFRVMTVVLVVAAVVSVWSVAAGGVRPAFGDRATELVADPEKLAAALLKSEQALAATSGTLVFFVGVFFLWVIVALYPLLRQVSALAVDVQNDRATQKQIEEWQLSREREVEAPEKV